MRVESSAQVASTRASACRALAPAASLCSSRLPHSGKLCISVYSVSPTFQGSRLGPALLPRLPMFINSARSTGSGKAPAGPMRCAAASASCRMARSSGLCSRAWASRSCTLLPRAEGPAAAVATLAAPRTRAHSSLAGVRVVICRLLVRWLPLAGCTSRVPGELGAPRVPPPNNGSARTRRCLGGLHRAAQPRGRPPMAGAQAPARPGAIAPDARKRGLSATWRRRPGVAAQAAPAGRPVPAGRRQPPPAAAPGPGCRRAPPSAAGS